MNTQTEYNPVYNPVLEILNDSTVQNTIYNAHHELDGTGMTIDELYFVSTSKGTKYRIIRTKWNSVIIKDASNPALINSLEDGLYYCKYNSTINTAEQKGKCTITQDYHQLTILLNEHKPYCSSDFRELIINEPKIGTEEEMMLDINLINSVNFQDVLTPQNLKNLLVLYTKFNSIIHP